MFRLPWLEPMTSLARTDDRAAGRSRRGLRRPAPLPERRRARADARAAAARSSPSARLNDWGRSERVEGLFDQTLVEFFYRYWFRAEVEGVENVPSDGGALLVSNHSGALPPDAAMIAKAIREEHPAPRPLNITVEHFFKGYPGFSMLIPKIGCVAAHPANVHRLLYDEEQLVLVFPEGRKGTEKLYKDRYRLRRFGRGGFVEAAMRAEAKLVPVCVVGAEEAAPVFAQSSFMKRLTGLLYFPLTPTFPWLGPLGMLGYLPAKFKIRFLEPIDTRAMGGRPGRATGRSSRPSPRRSARGSRRTCTRCSRRESRSGSDDGEEPDATRAASSITGLSTYWGGRLAQALEGFPEIEAIIGVDNRDPTRELERTEFVKRLEPALADPADRRARPRSTR